MIITVWSTFLPLVKAAVPSSAKPISRTAVVLYPIGLGNSTILMELVFQSLSLEMVSTVTEETR